MGASNTLVPYATTILAYPALLDIREGSTYPRKHLESTLGRYLDKIFL